MSTVRVNRKSLIVVFANEIRFVHDSQNVDAGIVLSSKSARLKFAKAMRDAANLLEQANA
jgi:hypothetical protein